ncbi:GNAT family N-acetyltransferase [Pseudokineococcus sp. 1T1Z-3]|uniref:GNAT family N-acetyltransferase n=1 Tax=Pseudokineococcus sp. 1T1Z-3 TaxID=3132745 RepID=UPI0030964FE1
MSTDRAPLVRRVDVDGEDGVAVDDLLAAAEREEVAQEDEHLGPRESSTVTASDRPRSTAAFPSTLHGDAAVHLATVDDEAAGVAIASPNAEVLRLWVVPISRRLGIGSALLDAVVAGAPPGPVRLHAWEWDASTLALARSRGFVPTPSWHRHPRRTCVQLPSDAAPCAPAPDWSSPSWMVDLHPVAVEAYEVRDPASPALRVLGAAATVQGLGLLDGIVGTVENLFHEGRLVVLDDASTAFGLLGLHDAAALCVRARAEYLRMRPTGYEDISEDDERLWGELEEAFGTAADDDTFETAVRAWIET